jgi:hypothetical protein
MLDYLLCNWHLLCGGALLGFCIGILTGLFGAGGGFILTPALNIFLGLEMNFAVGTSALQILGASAFSLYHHLDRNFYGIRVALLTGIGIPFGSISGVYTVGKLVSLGNITVMGREMQAVNFILLCVFMVFLSVIAAWLFIDNFWLRRNKDDNEDDHKGFLSFIRVPPLMKFRTIPSGGFSIPVLVILGFFIGFLSGLLGIGGGVVMMPLLFYFVGQQTKFATATSTMLVFTSGLFASVSHAIDGNVRYILALVLISGAFFGARAGVRIHKNISGKSIRKYFAFVVVAAVILVAYKLWRMLYT